MENADGTTPGLGNVNTCTGKMEIPTPREKKALQAMKSIKERVRVVKKRLDELKAQKAHGRAEEVLSLEDELKRLKEEWRELDTEREAAAKERMILLGHESESS